MSEHQLQKLRSKFIRISTLSFFGVMLLMGGLIYLFSEITLRNEVHQIMDYIIENDGQLPDSVQIGPETGHKGDAGERTEEITEEETETGTEAPVQPAHPHQGSSPEDEESFDRHMEWSLKRLFGVGNILEEYEDFVNNTSYFAVLFDEEDQVENITSRNISFIDREAAERYARIAAGRMFGFGSFGRFYYCVRERVNGQGRIVIYIDQTAQVSANNRILFAALTLLGAGTLLAFLLMRIFSVHFLRSEIENAEKQKQFITNASHELKTPLAVIRANTEMQEIIGGENEWTQSTMRQVDRMSGLIGNLVKIARAQEMEAAEMREIDVSGIVEETAASYVPVAASEGKKLEKEVALSLIFRTDEGSIRQLTSLLLDNAVKYCDEKGTISVTLKKSGKNLLLSVSNDYAAGKEIDYSRFFERFYRADESHHSEKGGYGIGLSIAESLTKTLGGTLDVNWKNGRITFRALMRGR